VSCLIVRHAPREAPRPDLRQAVRAGVAHDPLLEGDAADFLPQMDVGQDIQRKHVENRCARLPASGWRWRQGVCADIAQGTQSCPVRVSDRGYPVVVGVVESEVVRLVIVTSGAVAILRNDPCLSKQLEQGSMRLELRRHAARYREKQDTAVDRNAIYHGGRQPA